MCACSRAALVKIDRRLRTPAQFAAVATARGPERLQGARRWLALTAYWIRTRDSPVVSSFVEPRKHTRLGLVVPKRWARRALDRNLVKRVAREAMLKAGPELDTAAKFETHDAAQLDVVIRLKAALPPVGDLARARLRVILRTEADALLATLAREMHKADPMDPASAAAKSASDASTGPM